MRLSVECLTTSCLMLSNWPNVLAHVDLLNPDVLIAPRATDRCFIIVPGPGRHLSMSAGPGQVRLEVDNVVQAIINLRADNVTVCFHGPDMFAIRII